ncbi:MAG: 30S ribosomal protein S8 [bacterium LCO1.1]|uniref:Small ribosomal subunit protein uS8 n=1 Tax=Candidatus Weimeria bifida TaxID=2599074 RepID=A0A6N7IXA6_9FIRM|nr:30S ribosomal protein S8 [Candidatus Weimeria bifida]
MISGITRIAKPGLRIYDVRKTFPSVLGGLGIAIFIQTRESSQTKAGS